MTNPAARRGRRPIARCRAARRRARGPAEPVTKEPLVTTMSSAPVLIGGTWRPSKGVDGFTKRGPTGGEHLGDYPVSPWEEVAEALDHGTRAYRELAELGP